MSGSYWNGSTHTAIGGGWRAERAVPRVVIGRGRRTPAQGRLSHGAKADSGGGA
jgi:hypothetical protein